MWNVAVPIWELVLRGAVVYVFLLALLRLTEASDGNWRRSISMLLLVLSNAVQNSMTAETTH
jgi:hypothetical protein